MVLEHHRGSADLATLEEQADMNDANGETWLPVVGHEGTYEVSSLGRVQSIPRIDSRGISRPGRILGQYPNKKSGRLQVSLYKDGSQKTHPVHRLVAAAFIGPCPDGMEVCHGPRGMLCNEPGNLRYDTRRNNLLDEVPGECPRCGGEWRPRRSHPEHRYCPECAVTNAERWRAANPEKASEIQQRASRRYRESNREEVNARQLAAYHARRKDAGKLT
jgi:NUMOD4 motif-containing protein/HNH endonuclease